MVSESIIDMICSGDGSMENLDWLPIIRNSVSCGSCECFEQNVSFKVNLYNLTGAWASVINPFFSWLNELKNRLTKRNKKYDYSSEYKVLEIIAYWKVFSFLTAGKLISWSGHPKFLMTNIQ